MKKTISLLALSLLLPFGTASAADKQTECNMMAGTLKDKAREESIKTCMAKNTKPSLKNRVTVGRDG